MSIKEAMDTMETINDEKKIVNYPEPITIEETNIILEQMKNCIFKIYKGKGSSGTGFFCKIPYKNEELKVLITCNHVIDENYIKNNEIIKLYINNEKNIKIYH